MSRIVTWDHRRDTHLPIEQVLKWKGFVMLDGGVVLFRMDFSDSCLPTKQQRLRMVQLVSSTPALLRGCQAAQAYLVDPSSKYQSNRDEAAKIIMEAVQFAQKYDGPMN